MDQDVEQAIAAVRSEVAELQNQLSGEVRTRRVAVIDADGEERVILSARHMTGSVRARLPGPAGETTGIELVAAENPDGEEPTLGVFVLRLGRAPDELQRGVACTSSGNPPATPIALHHRHPRITLAASTQPETDGIIVKRPEIDEQLRSLLTPERPFGPASADEFHSRQVAMELHISETEIDKTVRKSAPVFMIGRRGSGKTAVLKTTYPEGRLDVDLDAAVLLNEVAMTIDKLGLMHMAAVNELVAPLWDTASVAALCARIHHDYCRLTSDDCPEAFQFGALERQSDRSSTQAASRFLAAVRSQAHTFAGADVSNFLDSVELNGIPYYVAERSLRRAAVETGCEAVVSIDSLDHYDQLMWREGMTVSAPAQALQSLFRSASAANRRADALYSPRVAFPAELWYHYKDLSENPLKDFDSFMLLHWDGHELIRLAASRLLRYIQLQFPEEFVQLDLSGTRGQGGWAQAVLTKYLPKEVENSLGKTEPTIPYILRHTQLLPRHFIVLLNNIFKDQALREDGITANHVREAVASTEGMIADTIMDAYSLPYGSTLRGVAEAVVPKLNLRFSYSELHRVINGSQKHGLDFYEIVRMFVETGILGRVVEVTQTYAKAEFEYSSDGQLFFGPDDELCLHPIFAARFNSRVLVDRSADENQVPVYPRGSDFEVDQVRNHGGLRD